MKAFHPPSRTLPLGVDLGATRVRVALAQETDDGRIELIAVAGRDHAGDPFGALADAVAELRTRERRCVFGLGEPRAILRRLHFPPMRRGEKERAARFEASHFVDYPIDEAAVRVVSLGDDGETVIGVVRKDDIAALVAGAHAAKLRVTAIDNDAFAFKRALPDVDAILDIGLNDSRLHIYLGHVPISRHIATGGAAFTQAVAAALGTDALTAQRRKHAHGIAGCADAVLDMLVSDVAAAFIECRAEGIGDVRSMALVGNGARLSELPAVLERATAVRVRLAALAPEVSQTLPPDVLRSAAPDWCLAYGLAQWTVG